jgi:uncharacterized SAM-binding protein YcdF (DUF218 family)
MFFVLSKTLTYFIYPFTFICFLLGYILLFRKNASNRKLSFIVFGLILFFSNSYVINTLLENWELKTKPIQEMPESYEVGIVLGGFAKSQFKTNDRIYYTEAADRLIHAVLLYRKGKIKKILISGQFQPVAQVVKLQNDPLVEISIVFGVPIADLLLEDQSQNTYENAQYSEKMLLDRGYRQRHLLITSAFHARRAAACFKKTRIQFDVFSTHYLSEKVSGLDLIKPDVYALMKWQYLIKEWLGWGVYKMLHYA